MHWLPLSTRPLAPPSHHASSSFSVSHRRAACCCSLKELLPGCRRPPPSFIAVTQRVTAPFLAASLLLAAAGSSDFTAAAPPAFAQAVPKGAALFRKACIGCHDMGGNILQPGATLFMKDLERNGVASEEEIYNITYYGKGRMPGFGEKCTPRGQCTFGPRLPEDDIKLLAAFVKSQADNGWPKIDADGDAD